jgi:hypothetical protein
MRRDYRRAHNGIISPPSAYLRDPGHVAGRARCSRVAWPMFVRPAACSGTNLVKRWRARARSRKECLTLKVSGLLTANWIEWKTSQEESGYVGINDNAPLNVPPCT